MVRQSVKIKNKLGIHARPAIKLFELVQSFDAEVMLHNDSSVIALLMLDSAQRWHIEVEATVPEEAKALSAVVALFKSGFDED